MAREKVGIMGGSFDPIHNGHLFISERARENYGLDRIIFIPAGDPPHKTGLSEKSHRCRMTEIAIENNKYYQLSRAEIDLEDKSYTIDTLRYLDKIYPDTEFYFILGADSLLNFHTWKGHREIIENYKIIVANRATGFDENFYNIYENYKKDYSHRIFLLKSPTINISSTYIRGLKGDGKSIKYMMPEGVYDYIIEKKLYKGGRDE